MPTTTINKATAPKEIQNVQEDFKARKAPGYDLIQGEY
jgi:hypothetical protein